MSDLAVSEPAKMAASSLHQTTLNQRPTDGGSGLSDGSARSTHHSRNELQKRTPKMSTSSPNFPWRPKPPYSTSSHGAKCLSASPMPAKIPTQVYGGTVESKTASTIQTEGEGAEESDKSQASQEAPKDHLEQLQHKASIQIQQLKDELEDMKGNMQKNLENIKSVSFPPDSQGSAPVSAKHQRPPVGRQLPPQSTNEYKVQMSDLSVSALDSSSSPAPESFKAPTPQETKLPKPVPEQNSKRSSRHPQNKEADMTLRAASQVSAS